MRSAHSTESIRDAEQRTMAEVGDAALMQRAAAGLAAVCAERLRTRRGRVTGSRVLVVAGPGNNGGDGLYAAARLARRGAQVSAWWITERVHPQAWQAFIAAGGRRVGLETASTQLADEGFDLLVEAGFGIGGRSGLSPELARVAEAARGSADVVAVDLPSGLGVDEVRPSAPVFTADATVTFGTWKPCLLTEPGCRQAGEVHLVEIGIDPHDPVLTQWQARDVAAVWPFPGATSDKYSRGVLGVDAGSAHYPGAALLATGGAVFSGPGMVRFLGSAEAGSVVVQRFPNVVTASGRCQAYLLGPGWGDREDGRTTIESVLDKQLPVVLDADALGHLPTTLQPTVLLTPHAGELARLLEVERGTVESDPLSSVQRAADDRGATVLLKGATQYVAEPGGSRVWSAVPGPAWTAQAGSGDTLAGVCGTLLAAGLRPREAALAAASLQAMTAGNHPGPLPPQELATHFPEMVAELQRLEEENR